MEYPFKDLQRLDEATARTGYYKDWTHIDADTFHQISELVTFIREKGYGADTREAIAQALERVYHDAAQSGNANMEVSMARKHFKDLATRLEAGDASVTASLTDLNNSLKNIDVKWINKNLGKLDQTFMTEEFLQQMAGNTPINAVPADGAITTPKIAEKAVTADRTNFLSSKVLSNNYFDSTKIIKGKMVGGYFTDSDAPAYFKSDKIYDYDGGEWTIYPVRAYRIFDELGEGVELENTNSNSEERTITVPAGGYFEFSGATGNVSVTQVNKGDTRLPYDVYRETQDFPTLNFTDNQVENISNRIIVGAENAEFIESGTNLFDPTKIEKDKFISGRYTISDLPGYFKSERFEFDVETKVVIYGARTYRIFDANGEPSHVQTGSNLGQVVITVPAGGAFDFSGSLSNLGVTQVNRGEVLLPYEEYTNDLTIPNLVLTEKQASQTTGNSSVLKLNKLDNDLYDIVFTNGNNVLRINVSLKARDNEVFNFIRTYLNGESIHSTGDDITPIRTITTVGANHGYTADVVGDAFPENMKNGQLYPSVKDVTNSIKEIDGEVIVKESYEILDLDSLLLWKAINPTLDYVQHLDDIESVAKVITTYTFYGFGKCRIDTTLIFLKETPIRNIGFMQSDKLASDAIRYVSGVDYPDVDFGSGVNLATYTDNVKINASHLVNENEPPLFYSDTKNNISFTMGYIPEQDVSNDKRLLQTETFWDFRGTGKSYPIALDSTSSPVQAGSVFQVSGFRNYNITDEEMAIFEVVESGEFYYIYIHSPSAHGVVNRALDIPTGKKIEEVINNGIDLLADTTGAGGITFSTQEKSYAIFKIAK